MNIIGSAILGKLKLLDKSKSEYTKILDSSNNIIRKLNSLPNGEIFKYGVEMVLKSNGSEEELIEDLDLLSKAYRYTDLIYIVIRNPLIKCQRLTEFVMAKILKSKNRYIALAKTSLVTSDNVDLDDNLLQALDFLDDLPYDFCVDAAKNILVSKAAKSSHNTLNGLVELRNSQKDFQAEYVEYFYTNDWIIASGVSSICAAKVNESPNTFNAKAICHIVDWVMRSLHELYKKGRCIDEATLILYCQVANDCKTKEQAKLVERILSDFFLNETGIAIYLANIVANNVGKEASLRTIRCKITSKEQQDILYTAICNALKNLNISPLLIEEVNRLLKLVVCRELNFEDVNYVEDKAKDNESPICEDESLQEEQMPKTEDSVEYTDEYMDQMIELFKEGLKLSREK